MAEYTYGNIPNELQIGDVITATSVSGGALLLPVGKYLFEVYGRKYGSNSYDGNGSCCRGTITLTKPQSFLLYASISADVRLDTTEKSRIIVAGSGGAAGSRITYRNGYPQSSTYYYGGSAGLQGSAGGNGGGGGGTQTANGTSNTGGNAGGKGYYDGGTGSKSAYSSGKDYIVSSGGGGGGSCFISGHSGCNAVDSNGQHTGQPNHYSGLVFTDTSIESYPETTSSIKITVLELASFRFLLKSNDICYWDGTQWQYPEIANPLLPTQEEFEQYGMKTLLPLISGDKPLYQLDSPKLLTYSGDNYDLEITITEQVTNKFRFLVSKDNRATWHTYKGMWTQSQLSDIHTEGMTKGEIEAITPEQWDEWFVRGTLDFAVGISGTSLMEDFTFKGFTVTFPPNEAPLIVDPTLTPESIHHEFVNLEATLIDQEGDRVEYQILINDVQVYPSINWASVSSGATIKHGYNYPYFNTGTNTITLKVRDERGLERTPWVGTVTLTNDAPIFTTTIHNEFTLKGVIGDVENDKVAYRIFLNGVQKYPSTGFTNFTPSPCEVDFSWQTEDIKVGEENVVKIEFKDTHESIDSLELKFTGIYKGIVFVDENEDLYSNHLGEVIKYLDAGTLIAGQSTIPINVWLKNHSGGNVNNILLTKDESRLPQGVDLYLSKEGIPFEMLQELPINMTLAHGEKVRFYLLLTTDEEAVGQGEFDVLVSANPIA